MSKLQELVVAEHCIEKMKEYSTFRNHRIGVVRKAFNDYHEGEIVVCVMDWPIGELPHEDSTLTVEKPLTEREISRHHSRGSLITTICTTVGVPISRVAPFSMSYLGPLDMLEYLYLKGLKGVGKSFGNVGI